MIFRTSYRLGFDIGGTFTDLVAVEEKTGKMTVVKCPTTPHDPSEGVIKGLVTLLRNLEAEGDRLSLAVHSTTLITNTVIERNGAPTALLTTKGFRDVLEIGRESRITVYDIFEEKLPPLVPRKFRLELDERTLYDGTIERRISDEEVVKVARKLEKSGIESVAIVLIHSYANPTNEKRIKELLSKNATSLSISLSSEILPEWREYERASTTVINAYTQPKTAKYMQIIENALRDRGFSGRLYIMQSSGGLGTVESVSHYPVKIIESGPAAGALAASYLGTLAGASDMISFDMGGTTAKCCLITRGEPRVTTDFEVAGYMYLRGSGYPVRIPTVDLLEIGAGGGSIAYVDYGLLKVGPKSAGADPGPACYPTGGDEPTVTDADLILGYLNPDYFLGGEIRLDMQRSVKSIEEKISSKLGLDVKKAAEGISEVVNTNMARAMRIISVERGQDPSKLSLVAFGGAGPVHAFGLAKHLKIHKIIVPFAAGATSALGLLVADMKFDFVRTYRTMLSDVSLERVKGIYEEMFEEAEKLIPEEGYKRKYLKSVDMRYFGQAYELTVPFGESFDEYDIPRLQRTFLDLYSERYGYARDDPVECVSWRLVAYGQVPKVNLTTDENQHQYLVNPKGERQAYFPEIGGFVSCKVYDRYRLTPGTQIGGPAIIEEKESTCVVSPTQKVSVDKYQNLIVEDVPSTTLVK